MAATNLLAPVFLSQLILLFTLTSRPCVGNGDGTRLSVMAAGFGVPIRQSVSKDQDSRYPNLVSMG